jgi:outer membrane protein TolC
LTLAPFTGGKNDLHFITTVCSNKGAPVGLLFFGRHLTYLLQVVVFVMRRVTLQIGVWLLVLTVPGTLVAQPEAKRTSQSTSPVSSKETHSLQQLLEVAQKRAPTIRRAKGRLGEAKANLKGAKILLPYNPSVQGGLERFPLGEFSYGEAKLGLSQKLEISGERRMRIESAEAKVDVAEARLQRVRWRVDVQVRQLYATLLIAHRQSNVAKDTLEFSKELFRIARDKFEGGETSKVSVEVARTQRAQAKQALIGARSRVESTSVKLKEAIGLAGDQTLVPEDELPPLRKPIERTEITSLVAEGTPTIGLRKAAVKAANRKIKEENREYWPDPTVGLFYKNNSPDRGDSVHGGILQFSVPIPLWNRNTEARQEAQAKKALRKTELRTTQFEIRTQALEQRQVAQGAYEQIQSYRSNLIDAFSRQLDMLERGYEAGQFDVTDVTVAKKQLTEARRKMLKTMQRYVDATAELERLIGIPLWFEKTAVSQTSGGETK